MPNQNQDASQEPVGQGDYVVSSGECMDSIGVEHGFFWETLWKLPENAGLRDTRKDPFVLLEGDRVHIPPLRLGEYTGATERRHRFRRRGVPSRLKIQMLDEDQPIANAPYVLIVDGKSKKGATDGNGWVDEPIPPNAAKAVLRLNSGAIYEFQVGGIDPVTTIGGVRARLENLGFDCQGETGPLGPKTSAAIGSFQAKHELETTGKLDDATRKKLVEVHKC